MAGNKGGGLTAPDNFGNSLVGNAQAADFYTGQVNTANAPVDPFVSGYAYIKWVKFPSWMETDLPNFRALTEKNLKSFTGMDDITLDPIAVQAGFIGTQTNFAGAAPTVADGFSMTHSEYQGSPMARGYAHWASSVRDPRTGVAAYPKATGLEYASRNHTGHLLYFVVRPDANNIENPHIIEYASYYTNVMPAKIPLGHLNFTSGTSENPVIDMPFWGQRHIGAKVDQFAAAQLKNVYKFVLENDFDPSTGQTTVSSVADGGAGIGQ